MSTPQLAGQEWSHLPIDQTGGAVRGPDNDFSHSADGPGRDAIREGKQKAKETMAAAGFDATASPATTRPHSTTPNGFAHPNGTPTLSRKRSRDGTQLPVSAPSAGSNDGDAPRLPHDQLILDRYIQRDLLAAAAYNDQAERSRATIMAMEQRKARSTMEMEERRRRLTHHPPPIFYAKDRAPPNKRRPRELQIRRKDNQMQAEQHEELVPVRLDLELDKLRLRDTFTWNLHEKLISPDQFIDYLLEDLRVPTENLAEVGRHVRTEMYEQIHNYYPHIVVEDGPLEPGRPYFEHKDDEMRIQIKLNITIGRITLIDQFEWDINNPENSPEEFARSMAGENALSGEFTTAIAHAIREQSQLYTKSLYLTNHPFDGRPVEDPELRDAFLPAPLHSAFRPSQTQKDFTPYMYEMSEAELDRTEHSMLREHRANKRQLNRRGGPALPDLRDRQRTVRSLLVHSVIPGGVESFETTGILKARRGNRSRPRGTARPDGGLDSDDDDDDSDSGPDSPAPSMSLGAGTGGTARTRGMRGAAAAAQASMRAGFGRSQTPDGVGTPGAHDATPAPTSRSARRSMLREESVAQASADDGADSLIVRLKWHNKAKFRAWVEAARSKKRAAEYPLSGYASQPPAPAAAVGTPVKSGTPVPAARNEGAVAGNAAAPPAGSAGKKVWANPPQYDERGAIDIDVWPAGDAEAVSFGFPHSTTMSSIEMLTRRVSHSPRPPPGSLPTSPPCGKTRRMMTSPRTCGPTGSPPRRTSSRPRTGSRPATRPRRASNSSISRGCGVMIARASGTTCGAAAS